MLWWKTFWENEKWLYKNIFRVFYEENCTAFYFQYYSSIIWCVQFKNIVNGLIERECILQFKKKNKKFSVVNVYSVLWIFFYKNRNPECIGLNRLVANYRYKLKRKSPIYQGIINKLSILCYNLTGICKSCMLYIDTFVKAILLFLTEKEMK